MHDQPTSQPFYRTRGWLIGTTVAIVAALTALVVVLTVTGGGPGRPRSPQAAAREWAKAQLHNQKDVVRSLQCSDSLRTGLDAVRFTGQPLSGLTAGVPTPDGSNRWLVTMRATAGTASAPFDIHVVRRNGDYLVCD